MSLNIQQQDYNIMSQPYINKYMKLNILNFDMNVVDEISGNLVSCDVSVNADSDLRRSCSVSLIVVDSSFDVGSGNRIWLDKFIQPFVGYENIYTGEIQWYNQGIYLINAPSYSYDATNNTLSFSGLDLMSKLTGLRNGALPGVPTVVPQGSSVREAIIAAIKLAGFNKYVVDECTNVDGNVQSVPYDIQVDQGGYIFDIIKQLRDILPNYQVYFDVDGVFHYDQIPSGNNDPVLIDDNLWDNVLVAESISTDFEKVKNYIEVYGKSHAITNYSSNTTVSGAQIRLTLSGYTETAGNMIGFTLPNNIVGNITIKVNNLTARNLVDSNGAFITSLDKDVYYVAVLRANNTYEFLGHQQAQAIVQDDNPNSPFYVNGTTGIIREVLYGGDYDNIMSDDLALQRAKLELYWKCRLNDGISLSCIPIPWLDVNILVSHAPRQSAQQKQYMVKSFSASYGDVAAMNISAITYYPYYNPTPEPTPILPEGYTQLNYIQSTGTQYIDTGVMPNQDTVMIAKMAFLGTASDNIAGARNSSNDGTNRCGLVTFGATSKIGALFGTVSIQAINIDTEVHEYTLDKTGLMIDGTSYGDAYSGSFSCTYPITLFAWNNGADGIVKNKSQIYGCKLYSGSTLIRNFTPCKNPSGEVGLYDYVTKAFYGNVGGGSLPDGYTELEYLQSTGAQYIDSGVKGDSDVRVTADFEITAFGSGTTFIFGAQGTDSVRYTLGMTSAGAFRSDFGTSMTSGSAASLNTRYSADKNGNVCTVGGQTLTSAAATFTGTTNIYLFGRSYSSVSCSKIKMYRCKMYKAGTLIRDFAPCKNPDGVAGLYDIVNGTFYTNQGSGTFTAGADINNNFLPGE